MVVAPPLHGGGSRFDTCTAHSRKKGKKGNRSMANSEELKRLVDEYALLLADANHEVAKARAKNTGLRDDIQSFTQKVNEGELDEDHLKDS
jgi:hypothetical protein